MLRPIDATRLREELRRMQRLNEKAGVPRVAGHFQRVLKEGWVSRNPEIFHLYEEEGRLRGYAGLIPIYPESYRRFIDGERFPWADARPTDFLTPDEYARARAEGVWIWIESFMAADAGIRTALAEWVYNYLSEIHVKGLLVSSSDPQGEADCRWLGMVHLRDFALCPTGIRKLWYAEAGMAAGDDDHDFGPPVPVRLLFLTVRQRFGTRPHTLGLSPRSAASPGSSTSKPKKLPRWDASWACSPAPSKPTCSASAPRRSRSSAPASRAGSPPTCTGIRARWRKARGKKTSQAASDLPPAVDAARLTLARVSGMIIAGDGA